jgi:RNA recognition motif-containing protein
MSVAESVGCPVPRPSSRLIVKNLPKYITEKRVREHFAAQGDVTDVRLVRCQQTVVRVSFAFVGYKSVDDATACAQILQSHLCRHDARLGRVGS